MSVLQVQGARVFYRLEGAPGLPLLVLAHPIGGDHGLWDGVVPRLLPHLRVLRYDLRGHGASEATPGDYRIDQLSSDLLGLVEALGLGPRFHAAGISLGGMAALHLCATHPDRVDRLVIANALPWLPPPPDGWDARARAARAEGMATIAQRMAARQLSEAFRASGDPAAHTLQHACAAMPPGGYASACAVLRDTDLRPLLPRVCVPTLVITGAEDPMLDAARLQAMVDELPDARRTVLPTGHLSAVEAPAAFAQAVLSFLRES